MKIQAVRIMIGYSASLPSFTFLMSCTNPSPKAKPNTVPITSCTTMVCTMVRAETPPAVLALTTMPMSVVVSTYAIGSFAPDSSSSNGFRLCFSPIPLVRRTEKTLAESVLLMVAAISNASQIDIVVMALIQPKR